jgi:hypothetical protein
LHFVVYCDKNVNSHKYTFYSFNKKFKSNFFQQLHYLAIELPYFEYNLWKPLLILAWWKLKVAQFQKTIFVTTFFDHHNVLSPKTLTEQIESLQGLVNLQQSQCYCKHFLEGLIWSMEGLGFKVWYILLTKVILIIHIERARTWMGQRRFTFGWWQ